MARVKFPAKRPICSSRTIIVVTMAIRRLISNLPGLFLNLRIRRLSRIHVNVHDQSDILISIFDAHLSTTLMLDMFYSRIVQDTA